MIETYSVSIRIPKDNLEAQREFQRALRYLKDGQEQRQKGELIEFIFHNPQYYAIFVAGLLFDLRLYPEVEVTDGNGAKLRYEEKKPEEGAEHTSLEPRQFPEDPQI